MTKRKILFLTGTRADFGKLKTLIDKVRLEPGFECCIFVTGMHTLARYGFTVDEVMKNFGSERLDKGFRNVHVFMNQFHGESMDIILGNTIFGLSRFVSEYKPDMIVVHGDRVEALAGAIVGALRNILVAHVEGGELSGTIDELIRHAVSKMAHVHFVANQESKLRLVQMGEMDSSVYVSGSPDIDLMLSGDLPGLEEVRSYYQIPFETYGIVLFHPVTTNLEETKRHARALVDALLESDRNFVVIYPNNDEGSDHILEEYQRLKDNPRFRVYPSLRLTSFLTLLKNAAFLLGNSSAGVRETPVYGVPSINIGPRQHKRGQGSTIINSAGNRLAILQAMDRACRLPACEAQFHFGKGRSAERFIEVLRGEEVWKTLRQKQFVDMTGHLAQVHGELPGALAAVNAN